MSIYGHALLDRSWDNLVRFVLENQTMKPFIPFTFFPRQTLLLPDGCGLPATVNPAPLLLLPKICRQPLPTLPHCLSARLTPRPALEVLHLVSHVLSEQLVKFHRGGRVVRTLFRDKHRLDVVVLGVDLRRRCALVRRKREWLVCDRHDVLRFCGVYCTREPRCRSCCEALPFVTGTHRLPVGFRGANTGSEDADT
ncbi:hypothetical protein EI94DRAFT_1719916 [Lactarius quietus]|nr:hypothetical protein EI94DRAFT_1719916 [Lactarius quietus]